MGTLMETRDTLQAILAQSGPRGAAAVEEIGGRPPASQTHTGTP
jgi:hypothetical protein